MMISAKAMSEALSQFKELVAVRSEDKMGTIMIGTVKGDLHDIGKNLVVMMLEGQGFTVEDVGVSVDPEKFVEVAKEKRPDILAMSALLTTTMVEMKNTIDAIKNAGLRDTVKIIVGGAPVTQDFADQIGADGYASDAVSAVELCNAILDN